MSSSGDWVPAAEGGSGLAPETDEWADMVGDPVIVWANGPTGARGSRPDLLGIWIEIVFGVEEWFSGIPTAPARRNVSLVDWLEPGAGIWPAGCFFSPELSDIPTSQDSPLAFST
jgi:hypothetical protein